MKKQIFILLFLFLFCVTMELVVFSGAWEDYVGCLNCGAADDCHETEIIGPPPTGGCDRGPIHLRDYNVSCSRRCVKDPGPPIVYGTESGTENCDDYEQWTTASCCTYRIYRATMSGGIIRRNTDRLPFGVDGGRDSKKCPGRFGCSGVGATGGTDYECCIWCCVCPPGIYVPAGCDINTGRCWPAYSACLGGNQRKNFRDSVYNTVHSQYTVYEIPSTRSTTSGCTIDRIKMNNIACSKATASWPWSCWSNGPVNAPARAAGRDTYGWWGKYKWKCDYNAWTNCHGCSWSGSCN